MNILLPEQDCILGNGTAEVKNHKLYLHKNSVFKEIMYELTYKIFGSDECYYCHRKLRTMQNQCDNKMYFSKISVDHLIPRDFGGPTITNNLRPACTDCNTRKGNMFEDEYAEYIKIMQRTANKGKQGRLERKLYRQNIALTQELRRCGRIPSLPEEWISDVKVKCILVNYWISQKKSGSYEQMARFAEMYKYLINPVTITKNGFLVDGFNANLVATYYELPLIVLYMENVIYDGFPNEE